MSRHFFWVDEQATARISVRNPVPIIHGNKELAGKLGRNGIAIQKVNRWYNAE